MGFCFSRNIQCDNEAEELFRETLTNYKEITDWDYEQIIKDFKKTRVIELKEDEKQQEEDHKYNSVDYARFLVKFIDKSHSLKKFMKALPPSFDFLFDGHIQDKPEYNFSVWALPFLRNKNKFKYVRDICEDGDAGQSFSDINKFLDHFLEEVLVNMTARMDNVLQERDNGSIVGDGISVTENLKAASRKALSFFKNEDYRNVIKDEVVMKLMSIIGKKTIEVESYYDTIIKQEQLEKLHEFFPNFFNPLELRIYVWSRFYDEFSGVAQKELDNKTRIETTSNPNNNNDNSNKSNNNNNTNKVGKHLKE